MSAAAATARRLYVDVWVVYDHPTDWPDWYVARRWRVENQKYHPTPDLLMARKLGDLRGRLHGNGFTPIEPMPGDDPVIMETWL